ncbi:MAG: folate-binding protein YgfZ [Actinobacteria bacterium]|nr:folate-binding protein YgfZ [Actinomycetota bacterium]MBI3688843.1 folate-binding protein YgfZ [Actinomycetota bacterium]
MSTDLSSPLLDRAGAVPGAGRDAAVAMHYGDPLREQRLIVSGAGWVDRSHRGVVEVSGADRLSWLHDITSQHLRELREGTGTEALVLSPHGHVEHHAVLAELGGVTWLDLEPGSTAALLAYLQSMRFLLRVDPADVTAEWAVLSVLGPTADEVLARAGVPPPAEPSEVVSLAGGGWARRMPAFEQPDGEPIPIVDLVVPRDLLREAAERLTHAGAVPAGLWAYDALRVAARRPRLGVDTDHRTLPHEVGWIGVAVHLDKGCYRGQETVARVHNLGRPPRRLVLLHLSGESEELPATGDPVESGGRTVGRVGTAVRHHELGQLALALLKRSVSAQDPLTVGGFAAVVDPSSDLTDVPRARSDTMRL